MKQVLKESPAPLIDGHIAELVIDGLSYFVFPDARKKRPSPDRQEILAASVHSFDGDLRIGNNHYFIALSHKDGPDFSESKELSHNLSKREWDIVMHVAEGYVNKQIADKLHISEWTVSTHIRRIFAKLGVDSRAAMVFKCSNSVRKKLQA